MAEQIAIISVSIEDREDGGVRVYSGELPGLILSGHDKQRVVSAIIPTMESLLKQIGIPVARITAAQPLQSVLQRPSPRAVNMRIEQFVIEMQEAA